MTLLRIIAAALVAGLVLGAVFVRAETRLFTGTHKVVYELRNEAALEKITDYRNFNYRQRVQALESGRVLRVEIEVNLAPVDRSASFEGLREKLGKEMDPYLVPERGIQVGHPDLFVFADRATKNAATVATAVEGIADAVRQRLRYGAHSRARQDALEVLRAGEGSCVGFSNLAIALLRSVGIPARMAHGYLPPDYRWEGAAPSEEQVDAGGPHAWIEFFDPPRGWVFSDPISTKQFVDPHHLVRYVEGAGSPPSGGKGLAAADGTVYRMAEEQNELQAAGVRPEPERAMRGVPLGP